MGPIATAGIAAGQGLLSDVANYFFGKKRDERQFRHQRQMAEYAYSKDLEMWERQNLYNAPSAQMKRLKEAGLNPNLVYGKGVTGNTSGQMPKYQNVSADYKYGSPVGKLNVLQAYQDFKLRQAQINQANSDAIKKKAEADYANEYFFARKLKLQSEGAIKHYVKDWYYSKKDRVQGQKGGELLDSQLNYKQRQNEMLSNDITLKQLEVEWYEMLKKAGIGAQLGVPIMKMLLR